MIKSKKRVIVTLVILIVSLFIIYSVIVFRTINPIQAFRIWKNVSLGSGSVYEIQKGEYGGGDPDAHIYGYVFSSYDNTPAVTMANIGFHDIGHIYSNGRVEQTEYCTSEYGLHSVIEARYFYFGGYLLKYKIVGIA